MSYLIMSVIIAAVAGMIALLIKAVDSSMQDELNWQRSQSEVRIHMLGMDIAETNREIRDYLRKGK